MTSGEKEFKEEADLGVWHSMFPGRTGVYMHEGVQAAKHCAEFAWSAPRETKRCQLYVDGSRQL